MLQNADKIAKMNGERCWAVIADVYLPHLNCIDVDEFWFQQDGATARGIKILRETFEERA